MRILGKADEDDEIPEYNEIFKDDSVSLYFLIFICIIMSKMILGIYMEYAYIYSKQYKYIIDQYLLLKLG